ncbi:MAG: helix-turn-helix transcriptional regulator [Bacteroidota bacterium]
MTKFFGDMLLRLRKQQGLSQQQLADGAGIDRSFVSRLERGLISATIATIFKLAKPLNVRPSDIIKAFEKNLFISK